MKELKIGMIGLDTSHSIEFTKRMQAPDCPQAQKVEGMRVISCLRFPSAFQLEENQDKRQQMMNGWGVKVTRNIKEVVSGIDAIMLEINDPGLHLEYFKQVVNASKPIFVDKPPADTVANAIEIGRLAKDKGIKIFSASSLRYAPEVLQLAAGTSLEKLKMVMTLGALGKAPRGSSIVWYAVHAVEMLQQVLGVGAKTVFAKQDALGVVAIIEYSSNKRGMVHLIEGDYQYAILVQDDKSKTFAHVDSTPIYTELLKRIDSFFRDGIPHVSWDESVEVQAILNAMDESIQTGKEILVKH